MKSEYHYHRRSKFEKWLAQSILFNALKFILLGDKNIIFKTPEQKLRSDPKNHHHTVPMKTKDGDEKKTQPMKIKRYY